MGWGAFPTPSGSLLHLLCVPRFNSSLTPSTRRECQIPQIRDLVRGLSPYQMPTVSPGCYLCIWPMASKSEFPKTTCLSLIYLLEWPSSLRETSYVLDHQFISKGYNTETARWERGTGQTEALEREQCFRGLWMCPFFLNLHMFTNLEVFQTLSFWVLIEAVLHRRGWLNHRPLAIDLISSLPPLPGRYGVGLKFPTLNHLVVSPGN